MCCKQASGKPWVHLLDSLLTVCVIHQLVVCYWRGVWEIFDVQLLPDDRHRSAVVCVVTAYVLQSLVCLVEVPANFLCRSKRSKFVLWTADVVIFFVANLVGVSLWRGVWLLLDWYLLPRNPSLSAGLSHVVGVVLLWLLVCAHSVTVSGCGLDGQSPQQEVCLTPNYYLRLFFTGEPSRCRRRRGKTTARQDPTTDDTQ